MPTKQADPTTCLHPGSCGRLTETNRVFLCVVCMAQSNQKCTRILEKVANETGLEMAEFANVTVYACRCRILCWPWSQTNWSTKQITEIQIARLGPAGYYQPQTDGSREM